MSMKMLLKSAAISATLMFGFSTVAQAQVAGCEVTELSSSSKATDLYLKAETELLTNDNPQGAIAMLNQMRALPDLNCLEEGILLGLSAQVNITLEDYPAAIADLQTRLRKGFIPAEQKPQTLLAISQLYFQEPDLANGLNFMNQWIAAGGKPTRDQKYTLAQVNYNLDKYPEALRWLEQVFAADGPDADRSVYDFLILLYDRTGNKAKKAQLLEQLLIRNPEDRRVWDAISGEYFQAEDDRKAFEVQRAMYLGGILKTEDEIMRIVNFYNTFNAPYEAAKVLEKEINAGRISRSFERLELLANLYQVAREHERAVPVIERAAREFNSGAMYERLGRSYADLQQWAKAEEALKKGLDVGGVKDKGLAWVLIGQSRYERDDRAGAREAFRNANNRGGAGWLAFMASEDQTAIAFRRFTAQQLVTKLQNEKKACDKLKIIGEPSEACESVQTRLTEAIDAMNAI